MLFTEVGGAPSLIWLRAKMSNRKAQQQRDVEAVRSFCQTAKQLKGYLLKLRVGKILNLIV